MRVVTFGELMLRLAPNGYNRFFQNDQMQATFGGGEANVAVSLANYGIDVSYVTKLPNHAIGQAAVNSLRYFGIDTSRVIRGGDRIGIYYLERVPPSGEASVSMTAHIPQFRRRILLNSIGKKSWTVRIGSTLPALLLRWAQTWFRPAWMPAKRQSAWE